MIKLIRQPIVIVVGYLVFSGLMTVPSNAQALLRLVATPRFITTSEVKEDTPTKEPSPVSATAVTEWDNPPEKSPLPSTMDRPTMGYQSIPEPLVFDLVRPLTARGGELEVNSLFQWPISGSSRTLAWAPEVEYAFADGQAIELEFPLENQSLKSLKVAYQRRIGSRLESEKFVQGIQWIGKSDLSPRKLTVDALYLTGYRFNDQWSVFSMQGVRASRKSSERRFQGIFNGSIFRNVTDRLIWGVETNFAFGDPRAKYRMIMPQAHIGVSKHLKLQCGFGVEQNHGTRPLMAWRLIREF